MDSTIMDYELNIKSIFWRIEKLYRDRLIVSRFSNSRRTYTYEDFARRVRKTVTFLKRNGLEGKNVASIAWNTSRHLELYFAVPLSGGVLHTVNVRFHPREMDYVVEE
ncbi:MAG: AMP-binding protein, partial [Metallosphaera sp.]